VIAYEDASLFLYSGHQAMRPVIFSPADNYGSGQLESELNCITETAQMTNASYWLIADDDFEMELSRAIKGGQNREKEFEHILPRAFTSSRGRVRIYQTSFRPRVAEQRGCFGY
jgi:hypothetical protein